MASKNEQGALHPQPSDELLGMTPDPGIYRAEFNIPNLDTTLFLVYMLEIGFEEKYFRFDDNLVTATFFSLNDLILYDTLVRNFHKSL